VPEDALVFLFPFSASACLNPFRRRINLRHLSISGISLVGMKGRRRVSDDPGD
jgi:hypothetical protein